jgi:hypothetical protein
MALWWIGNLVLLVVVAPLAVVSLHAVLRQVARLNKLADEVVDGAAALSQNLESVPKLLPTQTLVHATHGLVGRYGEAILGMVRS